MTLENPARKGDAVAIQVEHSSTALNGPTSRYYLFLLATVARASKDGTVREVTLAGQNHSLHVARVGRVFTLPTKQPAARKMIADMAYPGQEWTSADELRASILAVETEMNAQAPAAVPFVDVATITDGDVTAKLSNAIRCF